jgi:hypothetical protein
MKGIEEAADAEGADGHRQDMVEIVVNNSTVPIHRGRRTVAEIKTAGGVPLAHELEEIKDGDVTPLADDASVVIKGEERFLSHPKDSGSS